METTSIDALSYGAYMHQQHAVEQQQILAEHKLMQAAQGGMMQFACGASAGCKRKASDEDDAADGGVLASNLAERRKLSMPRCMPGTMEMAASFEELPEDLNRKILAGINAATLQRDLQHASTLQHGPVSFPGASNSPSSPMSELQPGTPHDGFFAGANAAYPDFALYPASAAGAASDTASTSRTRLDSSASSAAFSSATASSSTPAFGIFEPAHGAQAAQPADGMCLDSAGVGSAHASAWDAAMPSYPPPPPAGHGAHCKSIPQLSVRHYAGDRSELWATCRDCGATTKVQESQPAHGMDFSP